MKKDAWRSRVNIERSILRRDHPKFHMEIRDEMQMAVIGGSVLPWHGNTRYHLLVELSNEFPIKKPIMIVVHPTLLLLHDGRPIPESSHDYHTSSNHLGYTQICFTDTWNPTMTTSQILLRGIYWLNFYSCSLITGWTIEAHYDKYKKEELL